MAHKRLSGEVKTFIVQNLARFETPAVVAAAVKRHFGLTISRQTVQAYDPQLRAGSQLSAKWRQLYEETRRAFVEDTSMIGISHVTVRLRRLQAAVDTAEENHDPLLLIRLLKQAKEEMDGVYRNRGRLTGRGRRPIDVGYVPRGGSWGRGGDDPR
jgi:hypothetical protein